MPIIPTINADIYDISNDIPKSDDIFMVDTNVWFWLTYAKGMPSSRQYLHVYINYISKALKASATLRHSGLTFAELSHLIEKTEREIFAATTSTTVGAKEFRHNYPSERNSAISEIEVSWQQVESFASQVDINVCKKVTDSCLSSLKNLSLDGYDLMIINSMKDNEIIQIITDDIDYCTVPGIQVYTANKNLIQLANAQNKLTARK